MSRTALILRYAGFAGIAVLANLAVQRLVLWGDTPETGPRFAAALAAGTLAGLVVKYLLDKRWIFDDRSTGLAAHSRRFGLYSLMGVATTAIFWATETVFWLVGGTDLWRETGAVLGLGVGYLVKYELDRRYVFRTGGAQ